MQRPQGGTVHKKPYGNGGNMSAEKRIWNYGVEEIKNGYADLEGEYHCLYCGADFLKGKIYESEEGLYDAWGMARTHVEREHGGAVEWILSQETNIIGISEVQKQLLKLMSEGKTDREMAGTLGIAESTVRNHRFKLREKEKQAKLFLALMEALEAKTRKNIASSDSGMIEELHLSAKMMDERYSITESEKEKTLQTYMDENGALKQFPAKEKKKIIILSRIMDNFKTGKEYTEKEINRILKRIYEPDYVAVRRALIEYGFMDRSGDGSIYRVKE